MRQCFSTFSMIDSVFHKTRSTVLKISYSIILFYKRNMFSHYKLHFVPKENKEDIIKYIQDSFEGTNIWLRRILHFLCENLSLLFLIYSSPRRNKRWWTLKAVTTWVSESFLSLKSGMKYPKVCFLLCFNFLCYFYALSY